MVATRPGSPAKSPTSITSAGASRQLQRPTAGEPAGANLRAAEILQDRDWTTGGSRGAANAIDRGAMTAVSAVRKVQTKDVDARADQRANDIVAVGRRTDGGDDLLSDAQMQDRL